MSNLRVDPSGAQVDVQNTGDRDGAEVVQLYVSPIRPATVRPVKELKAFAKVRLAAGAATTVHMSLDRHATSYWSETKNAWVSERGEYDVLVGTSSDRIALTGRITLEKTEIWRGL